MQRPRGKANKPRHASVLLSRSHPDGPAPLIRSPRQTALMQPSYVSQRGRARLRGHAPGLLNGWALVPSWAGANAKKPASPVLERRAVAVYPGIGWYIFFCFSHVTIWLVHAYNAVEGGAGGSLTTTAKGGQPLVYYEWRIDGDTATCEHEPFRAVIDRTDGGTYTVWRGTAMIARGPGYGQLAQIFCIAWMRHWS